MAAQSPGGSSGSAGSTKLNPAEPQAELPTIDAENPFPPAQAQAILEQMAALTQVAGAVPLPLLRLPASTEPADARPETAPNQPWKAELRYRALVEKIPAVTFMAGLDDAVHELYISPQIEALLGFSQQEWLENPFLWYTQLHPEDRQRWGEEFARTCATGVQFRSEYRLIACDGRTVWVHGECQIVKDELGRPLFLQGIAFDISENKRAEEALRKAHDDLDARVRERTAELAQVNDALRAEVAERKSVEAELLQSMKAAEAANKAKDQFMAVLSHELRTPLTPVLSTVQMMERDQTLTPEMRDAVAMVHRNIKLEARLIDDMLDLTRIARGKIRLRQEAVDAHESIEHALEICQPTIDAKVLGISLNLQAPLHFVWADPTRLQQMLWNLLSNAVKFTPHGGHVTVRSGNDETGMLVIEVSDTGVGIDDEVLPRLFNAFEQGEGSITRRFGGLGLGLTITKALAELHQGAVSAASAGTGKGATFLLRLKGMPEPSNVAAQPAPVAPPVPPQPKPEEHTDQKRQRILLVEDNEDTLRVMSKVLKSFGYDVITATGVKAALNLADKEKFDLLVSDIGLPDGSGWDIMRQLRPRQSLRGIALSGYGMDEDIRKSREAGFEHHLVKPVNFDVLHSAIKHVVP
ncbi:MAG TPA: ATP-binding protein [Tepidisphaeraceae bacterium]|jgi:PAS domain S-box-containing protein|nr:ATP-binding protein [Tepidisphaeraceae bacterium]